MDQFVELLLQGENEISWYEALPPISTGSFQPYSLTPRVETAGCNNAGNMNKRMIEYLRTIDQVSKTTAKDDDKQRNVKHKLNERQRREKEKNCYFALYSMLAPGTKNDKKSIVQMATKRVEELELVKKDLERRNKELQANNEGNKIRVKIDNPVYGIDSVLKALKCLKTLDSKPRMIQSNFIDQEFLAVLDTSTQMGAADVENALNKAMQEARRKPGDRWTA
ncbi:40S ribosomal protein S15-like isoform 1 [Hibiscus syriacus]|uniref:40S ribosomal protein S15-like isoform 1 n=1 Tax=Hibiscus syriacus TaxID=106335 RepID=A0A6A3BEU0_HIBSY|nr:transcription factor bHLH92-like [Hibiscus syriacus]KAE8714617.1 40S ribosomal protein S15-like isoform 1 [Hibiscus syriacus]